VLIQWTDKFATGNALVDQQHQALFTAINQFQDALDAGAGATQVDSILEFLDRYVSEHFTTEEFLMLRSDFSAITLHKVEHERLMLRVTFIRDLRRQDPALAPAEGLARFLGDWLQNHILQWDMALFEHLRANHLGE